MSSITLLVSDMRGVIYAHICFWNLESSVLKYVLGCKWLFKRDHLLLSFSRSLHFTPSCVLVFIFALHFLLAYFFPCACAVLPIPILTPIMHSTLLITQCV